MTREELHKQETAALHRLAALRERLCLAIHRAIARDGHHKSYEGHMEVELPDAFGGRCSAQLHCYVIGPSRHYGWMAERLHDLVNMMERDIDQWIHEADEDDE